MQITQRKRAMVWLLLSDLLCSWKDESIWGAIIKTFYNALENLCNSWGHIWKRYTLRKLTIHRLPPPLSFPWGPQQPLRLYPKGTTVILVSFFQRRKLTPLSCIVKYPTIFFSFQPTKWLRHDHDQYNVFICNYEESSGKEKSE